MNDWRELFGFVVNGIIAAVVHFSVLLMNIEIFKFQSAGLANFVAAVFGLTTSFIGNRHFVFKKKDNFIVKQASKFLVLYILIACFHGFSLYIWTDIYALNYLNGFLLISFMAVFFSYFGNKFMVFKT